MKKLVLVFMLLTGAAFAQQTWTWLVGRVYFMPDQNAYAQAFHDAGGGAMGEVSGVWATRLDAGERVSAAIEALSWCVDNPQAQCNSKDVLASYGLQVQPK